MKFWKMNGAGNDFLIINNLSGKIRPEQWPQIAQTVCERHRSVGADGLMAVEKSDSADYKMLFFNSDGSMGEMCGNGARCICRYGYETGLAGEVQHVETTAGLVTGWRMDARMYRVRLNDPTHIELDGRADIDGKTYRYAYVELGDPCIPHAVVEIPGLRTCNEDALRELGRRLRHYKAFPKGANVNFYERIGDDHLYERTFERGVEDFTLACGTGTGATVAALARLGLVSGGGTQVQTDGGLLSVDLDGEDIDLTGPAELTFTGDLPELPA